MYLISRSRQLTLPIRDRKVEYHPATGDVVRVRPALAIQFAPAGAVPPHARDAVQQLPGFLRGLGEHEDPFTRCGAVDTVEEARKNGWDDEELAYVEKRLLEGSSNGVEYVVVDTPRATKPWESYDEFVGDDAVEKILYTLELIGVGPSAVLAYERENLNRPELVEALTERIEKDAEDVVGVISA